MKRALIALCSLCVLCLFSTSTTLANVDDLEDVGPDLTPITARIISDVTITISTASGNIFLAATYHNNTVHSFTGAEDLVNAPLYPVNVSGTRFMSTTEDINSDMPITFEFSMPVGSFGLTTLDVLEDVDTSTDAEVRLIGFNGSTIVDQHVHTGIQGESGLDLDWEVYHPGGITKAILIKTAGFISPGYGIDDLSLVELSVPVEPNTWSHVKTLYR